MLRTERISRRLLGWTLGLSVALVVAGCPAEEGGEQEVEDLTIVVEADKSRIVEEEAALNSERQAVESERARLEQARGDIVAKLTSLSKQDRKTRAKLEEEQAAIETEQNRLRERANKFQAERERLETEKTQLLDRISQMTSGAKAGSNMEQREVKLAHREKDLASREKDLAEREAKLAQREAQATQTLQDLNSVLAALKDAPATRTVVVNAPAPKSDAPTASRSQAQKAQKALRQRMNAKGVLSEDLPPTAKTLSAQGDEAMGSKEWGDAVAAYEEALQIVDGIVINQSFVQGKMARLNRAITSTELNEALKKKVQGLLADIGDAAAEGRYDRANKKANQIALVLKGR